MQHPDSAGAPFAMMPAALDLLSTKTEAVETIQDAIAEIGEQTGETVQLIVLDTLSRMMPGGVDSEPKDVKAFLENADRLREATAAHVMILHHAGKDVERGMRGSSLLSDYADTVIEIKGGEADGPMRAAGRPARRRKGAVRPRQGRARQVAGLGIAGCTGYRRRRQLRDGRDLRRPRSPGARPAARACRNARRNARRKAAPMSSALADDLAFCDAAWRRGMAPEEQRPVHRPCSTGRGAAR